MNAELKHLPVNWRNGMAFSADHLNDHYLSLVDSLRDAIAINMTPFNYGLLGGESQKKYADSFNDNINNEKVEVSHCRAVTQNGSRIEIVNKKWEELNQPLSTLIGTKSLDTSKYWYVLLSIDPFSRIPEGVENEQESLRRKPNTRPSYHLDLFSLKDLKLDSLANAIPIAKFETRSAGSGLRKIEDYIPPCTRVNSHKKLMDKYEDYNTYLNNLKSDSLKIIEKIKYKRKNREQNHLADDIDSLCRTYLDHFVLTYDVYKISIKELPPVKMVEFFATMARVLNHSLDMAINKNHLLQYFNQYATNITAAQLEQIIRATFESGYTHYDISDSLETIDTFLGTLNEIFEKLVRLDYKELAPINMVTRSVISDQRSDVGREPTNRKIRVRHTGKEKFLGDDLDE